MSIQPPRSTPTPPLAYASGSGVPDATPAPAVAAARPHRRDATRHATPAVERASRLYTRSGRYYVDLRDLGGGREALIPAGQTRSTTDALVAQDIAAARVRALLAAKRLGERDAHFAGVRRAVSVGAFTREWFAYKRGLAADSGGYTAPRTLQRYEQAAGHLFEVLDQDRRIDAVDVRTVKRALVALRKRPSRNGGTLSAASLRQVIAAMQQVFDHAEDEGALPHGANPWRRLRKADRPKSPRVSRTDFLETYEGAALLDACDRVACRSTPLRPLVAAYLLTGGRLEEVKGLEVQDVDFRRKTVRFVSNGWRSIKDYDERTVPLWPQLARELRAYLAAHPRRTGLLFPGYAPRTGAEQLLTGSFHKPLKTAKAAAAEALGSDLGPRLLAKAATPQALRVTYCSARLQTLDGGKAVATWTVRAEMGHGSLAMITRVYGRIGEARHRSEVVEYVARPAMQ